jgi:DNA-binding LacI/PurR family transcriptional regulator
MTEQEVTIYDIAKEAEVSPATVSRVLTKKARVSEVKRSRVEEVIRKYDFKPNAVARGLSTGTRLLGLMTADIRNPFYATLVVECEKAANERGYTVLLCNMLNDKVIEEAHLEKLCAQRVEAIIQIGCRVDDLVIDPAYMERINRVTRTIPFISSGKVDGTKCFSVRIDHTLSMKLVMDHLVSLGHRDIALLGGAMRVRSTFEKYQQYIYLLGNYGLSFRDEYVQEGDYSESGGYDCMTRLLRCRRRPNAVIAINDYCAVGAMRASFDLGLSIPEDLSLVSFDNTFLSEVARPKLTTVDYNYPDFGSLLIDTAIRAAKAIDTPPELQFVAPLLIIRDSCAPLGDMATRPEKT